MIEKSHKRRHVLWNARDMRLFPSDAAQRKDSSSIMATANISTTDVHQQPLATDKHLHKKHQRANRFTGRTGDNQRRADGDKPAGRGRKNSSLQKREPRRTDSIETGQEYAMPVTMMERRQEERNTGNVKDIYSLV